MRQARRVATDIGRRRDPKGGGPRRSFREEVLGEAKAESAALAGWKWKGGKWKGGRVEEQVPRQLREWSVPRGREWIRFRFRVPRSGFLWFPWLREGKRAFLIKAYTAALRRWPPPFGGRRPRSGSHEQEDDRANGLRRQWDVPGEAAFCHARFPPCATVPVFAILSQFSSRKEATLAQ